MGTDLSREAQAHAATTQALMRTTETLDQMREALRRATVLAQWGFELPTPREHVPMDGPPDVDGLAAFLCDDEKLAGWYGDSSDDPVWAELRGEYRG